VPAGSNVPEDATADPCPGSAGAGRCHTGRTVDVLLPATAVLVLSVPIGYALALFVARGPELMAGFFGPVRPDPWPRGVQEEDPSFTRTFRLGPTTALPERDADEEFRKPETAPVSGAVRRAWRG
jgi:hypothetical protein